MIIRGNNKNITFKKEKYFNSKNKLDIKENQKVSKQAWVFQKFPTSPE